MLPCKEYSMFLIPFAHLGKIVNSEFLIMPIADFKYASKPSLSQRFYGAKPEEKSLDAGVLEQLAKSNILHPYQMCAVEKSSDPKKVILPNGAEIQAQLVEPLMRAIEGKAVMHCYAPILMGSSPEDLMRQHKRDSRNIAAMSAPVTPAVKYPLDQTPE